MDGHDPKRTAGEAELVADPDPAAAGSGGEFLMALRWLGQGDGPEARRQAHHLLRRRSLVRAWKACPALLDSRDETEALWVHEALEAGLRGPWADAREAYRALEERLEAEGLDREEWRALKGFYNRNLIPARAARLRRRPQGADIALALHPPHERTRLAGWRFPRPYPLEAPPRPLRLGDDTPFLLELLDRWLRTLPRGARWNLYPYRFHLLRQALREGAARAAGRGRRPRVPPDPFAVVPRLMGRLRRLGKDPFKAAPQTVEAWVRLGQPDRADEAEVEELVVAVLGGLTEEGLGEIPAVLLPTDLVPELTDGWEEVLATPRLYRWLDPLRAERVLLEWEGRRFWLPAPVACDLVGPLPEVDPFLAPVEPLGRWEQQRWPLERVLGALEGEGAARP